MNMSDKEGAEGAESGDSEVKKVFQAPKNFNIISEASQSEISNPVMHQ